IRFKSVLTSNCIAGLWFLFSAGRNTGPKPRSAFSSLRSNPVARASAASSGSSLSQRSIHPRRLFGGAVSGGNELSNSSSRSRRSLRVTDSLARPNRRANQRPITSNPRPDYPRIVPHSRNYYQPNQANGRLPTSFSPSANYTKPMVLVPTHHDLNPKLLLDNTVLPPAWGSQASSSSTNFDTYCSQDLELALDSIFNNQNVGPFVCRELIQRLVTSSPSPAYVYRVVQKFNDNGAGVRGDMQAVVEAILLDYEARSAVA